MKSIEKKVDSLIYPHKKRSRRGIGASKKTAIGIFVVMIAATLIASGALLSYYGKVTTTADVSQAVLVDGDSMPDSGGLTESISGVACNLVIGDTHWLTNNADKKVIVDLVSTKTSCPGGCITGDVTVYPEYHLNAMVDDDAFWVTLGSDIVWSSFVSASFDYLIDYDGGNLWIPQMNIVLRDGAGVGQYYAAWHSHRTGITGTVGARTSTAYLKDDFYIYELPSWNLLGLWSDTTWTGKSAAETVTMKVDVDTYQFDYFTRQAGDTSCDPNDGTCASPAWCLGDAGAQQKVWLSNFAMDPTTTIIGIGIPTPSQGTVLQNLYFRMLYDFACNAYPGDYTVSTTVDYIGTI